MAANDVPCCEPMFWAYLVTCVALVAIAGLMSGLTLGLMSLSQVELEVIAKAGRPQERKNAEKILPLLKNQHLLLCTLLIGNSLAMEALPIFIDSIMPAWSSVLISVTLIIVFGEIIPQAISSKYGLSFGAKLSVIVQLILVLLFPLSYPISKLLDWILGKKDYALLRRAELKTFVVMHANESGKGGELTHEETTIITGALDLTQKTVKDAMTPISKIFSLDINSKLDDKTMELIMERGHSRIPIYSGNPTNIIGLILVKNLIKCRPEDETPIRELTIRRIARVHDRLPLYDMKNQFLECHRHMAVVVKCKDDIDETGETAIAKTGVFKININSNSKQKEIKGMGHPYFGQNEQLIGSPSVSSSQYGIKNPTTEKVMDTKLRKECTEYLPFQDEEVIGLITLEDVMEELLQEEILDETDEYTDVHDKIKINLLTSPRLKSMGSPGVALASPVYPSRHRSTPHSSHTSTPVALYSPVSPYIRSPIARPTLSASPGKSIPRSPASFAGAARY